MADGLATHSLDVLTTRCIWGATGPRYASPRRAERRVPIALQLQWVQRDATAGYPLLLGNARGGRDEPSWI